METNLVKYDTMCRAIDEAVRVDEVVAIHNEAAALAAYAKQAKNYEAEQRARDIRLRAERRLGEMMAAQKAAGLMAKAGGDMKSNHRVPRGPDDPITLNEAGIDKHLAHRARKAAKQGRNVTPETKAAAIKMVFEQGKTKKEAEKATGITDIPMRRILATEKGRRKGAIIDATTLSATSQEKLAAAIRQHTRELEREFEGRVQAESWKRLNEMTLPFYLKEIERIENIITSRKGHMSAAQYTKIWSCLHPDRIDDEGLKKKFAEAFDIFSRLKPLLVSEEEHRIVAPDLPRTTAEWMAKKNEWMARKQKKA